MISYKQCLHIKHPPPHHVKYQPGIHSRIHKISESWLIRYNI